ncbi:hypothetical protein [Caulobacter sp. 17J65-9]|uniref:hypothetical protein n=1 Tax=Caulobacter sp. 17J65-9 TaxID=2709382 RepID=UPI0013CC9384|nr:hypothetical protein [Caulobacter sp. 17J65-9]NEX94649.1 hypothetical protein [Caulobacter sp. 17J65-9]
MPFDDDLSTEERDTYKLFLSAITPRGDRICSAALYRFFVDYYDAANFFMFVIKLVGQADEGRMRAAKALSTISPEDAERYKKTLEKPNLVLNQLSRFSSHQSKNMVLSATNSFLCYYSEIIQAAINKRPELLKSSQTIRLDEVLAFKRYSDIVSYLVDKRINSLSYGGILQMEEYMRDRLGIETFKDDDQKHLLLIFIELRNILTHNRGVVNDLFLSRVKNHMGFKFRSGKQFHCDLDVFARLSKNCIDVACDIDKGVCEKFGIQRKRYATWSTAGANKKRPAPTT